MARRVRGSFDQPLLTSLFGTFQRSAANYEDTATIWRNLRIDAGRARLSLLGQAGGATDAQLEEAGRQALAEQGIDAAQVSQYRGLAGQWLGARDQLWRAAEGEQIMPGAIFTPPWAITAGPEAPNRYRVRVQWEITPTVGESYLKWSSYEITSPLTSIGDVLDQAWNLSLDDKYLHMLSSGAPLAFGDYEIEQI